MAFSHSDPRRAPGRPPAAGRPLVPGRGPGGGPVRCTSAKLVVAGGFGVGKTTLVGAISEIPPVATDNWMTTAGRPHDAPVPGTAKTKTTVAMDFGRITLAEDLVLYLFGTPGQPRFWPMWDDLCRGASGAVVLVDTRRLEISFPAVNYFELDSDVPYTVAVNLFDGRRTHPLDEVRDALQLPAHVPLLTCDARDRRSVAVTLAATVGHAMRPRAALPAPAQTLSAQTQSAQMPSAQHAPGRPVPGQSVPGQPAQAGTTPRPPADPSGAAASAAAQSPS